jgi:SAM-dependent methyltransferase
MIQLRPFYSDDEEAKLYAEPYDHNRWNDHRERVNYTASLLEELAATTHGRSVADLSCGDGGVINAARAVRWSGVYLGDRTARPGLDVAGRIEDTLDGCPEMDLFVCTETLEHVRDPLAVLKGINRVARRGVILSTPLDEEGDDNPQHYWGWGLEDISGLLDAAGFGDWTNECEVWTSPSNDYYTHQIWMLSHQ